MRLYFSMVLKRSIKKLIRSNTQLKKATRKALDILKKDPFYQSLKTHKVHTRLHGVKYSSWVTGDIRLIWDYDVNDTLVLIMFDIGSHPGKRKVYN